MRKTIFSFALICACFCKANAQSYSDAIGLRLGYYSNFGLDYKHFLNDQAALDVIGFANFYSYGNYFNLGALYEVHKPLGLDNLSWYFGGGGFYGVYSYDAGYLGSESFSSIQIAGVLGLEFRIPNAPISLSLDWIPTFAITGGNGFEGNGGSLAVRYIFR